MSNVYILTQKQLKSCIFSILKKNKFPLKTIDRTDNDPLIFAGGPVVTSNPEPYKNIFDFMVIGDGEDVNLEVVRLCVENKDLTKQEKLKLLAKIKGIYVPNLTPTVQKITKKLTECIYTPIISENAFFKNTFILEVERGCSNRCGFCLASYMNMPIRFVDYNKIIETIDFGLQYTNKIALLGAQITAHPDFDKICKYVDNKIKSGEKIEMGISSLRVDSFKPEIVQTLVDAGQRNLTLAIEAGSERLRRVINKHLTEDQIFKAIDVAISCGLIFQNVSKINIKVLKYHSAFQHLSQKRIPRSSGSAEKRKRNLKKNLIIYEKNFINWEFKP